MPAVATAVAPPEQRVVLSGVSWQTYEALLADHVDRRAPRFAYDRGALEIVSPSPPHEEDGFALAQVVVTVAEELDVDIRPMGSTTYRRQALAKGFEADASFYVQNDRFVLELDEVDPKVDPPPDLVIEIDVSHSSLDKLPIYAAMGVPEVWRRAADRVAVLVLEGDGYREAGASVALPPLTGEVLTRLLEEHRTHRWSAWVRAVRAWVRAQRAGGDATG